MDSSNTPAEEKEVADTFPAVLTKGSASQEAGQPSFVASEHQRSAPEQHQDAQDTSPSEDPEVTMQLYTMAAESYPTVQVDTFDGSDRTQAMLTKYTFDLAQSRWPARNMISVERVSKPVRMRVRYTCHRCKTSFGHDKECNSCRHRRCGRCDRYPARKVRPAADPPVPTPTSAAPVEEVPPQESQPTIAESFCTCHECQTVIEVEVQECPNCQHTICEKCHTEARLQGLVEPNGDVILSTEEEERIFQPDEQKLPPESGAAEEQKPTVLR